MPSLRHTQRNSITPLEHKAELDGEFLTAIAEQPNEILKCAMYLFLGYLDGATQFAQSCGSGGGDTSLPWGRRMMKMTAALPIAAGCTLTRC